MTTLNGPCLSTAASGTLAKLLNFRTDRRGTSVRRRPVPTQPQTPAQISVRAATGGSATAWATLSDANRNTWLNLAAQQQLASYHAFQRYNIRRILTGQGPSQEYPAAETGAISDTNILVAMYTAPILTFLLWPFIPLNQFWTTVLHAGTPGFTPTHKNIVAVNMPVAGLYRVWHKTRPASGTWQFSLDAVTTSGKIYKDIGTRPSAVVP